MAENAAVPYLLGDLRALLFKKELNRRSRRSRRCSFVACRLCILVTLWFNRIDYMTKKRPLRPGPRKPAGTRRSSDQVRVERIPNSGGWRFLHPRCALERAEDLEEIATMLEQGEAEIATDELRWVLSGCPN